MIILATILAMIVRRLRRAKLGYLGEGRILWALVVTRFMTMPPPFILLVFSALASAFHFGFAGILWLATFYALLGCILISLTATLAAHLAAAIKGPRKDMASGA